MRLVSAGNIPADVGTDHGYIPIELVKRGHAPSAIAMDLRKGPLKRAQEHIAAEGLEGRISTRLSDGVCALAPGEADTIIAAGMGGALIIRILQQGAGVCGKAKELILQPQSETAAVRRFLRENGYRITDEDMVYEDGKFYPLMRAVYDGAMESGCKADGADETLNDIYGPLLLGNKHPVLKLFLEKETLQLAQILSELEKLPQSEKISERLAEVRGKCAYNEEALSHYME